MKTKKKLLIIIPVVILAVLLAVAGWFHMALYGSPIKRAWMKNQAEEYVAKNYPDTDYEVVRSGYDFKMNGYFCNVQSKSIEDIHFVIYERDGKLFDDYETSVAGKHTTIGRLESDLDEYVTAKVEEKLKYRNRLIICAFDNEPFTEEEVEKIVYGQKLDIGHLPHPAQLTVWIETQNEKPSWEELASRLREFAVMAQEISPDIRVLSVSLEAKYHDENGNLMPEDYNSGISVYDVPIEVIEGDGLEEYLAKVKAAQEEEIERIENGETDVKGAAIEE